MSDRRSYRIAGIGAFALALSLSVLTYRDGRRLTFDAYHYVELTKQFTHEWPDRFGNHWPFGYPVAGSILSRVGVPPFSALVLVSAGSVLALTLLAARLVASAPFSMLTLCALSAAPIVAIQFLGVLSELPFAALLLAFATCLAHWPKSAAIWGAAALAVLAFTIRYAGIIILPLPVVWLALHWRELRGAGRARAAVTACILAIGVAGGLLALNLARSGHLSGAGRGSPAGLSALPQELSDFGWSLPSAVIAGGIRERLGYGSTAGFAVGLLFCLLLAGLCVWAWARPSSQYSRSLALLALSYVFGMAVLHCIGDFDALYNARTFLPALFPMGLLAAERVRARPRWLALGCGLLLVSGLVAGVRGISQQVGADVRPALAPLRACLRPDDVVAINDDAFSVAAYISQRTQRVWVRWWPDQSAPRLLVVAARARTRDGTAADFEEDWPAFCSRQVADQRYRYVFATNSLIVLEKISRPKERAAQVSRP